MPSTTSPNVGLELQATGENDGQWGVKNNADLSIIDLRFGGRLALSVAGSSNVTLTTAQARSVYHNLSGILTGNIIYNFPAAAGGFYFIKNGTTGAFTITVKPTGGTGIVVPQGTTLNIFIDPDQTAAVAVSQPLLVTGGGLEYSSGSLQRSAISGDISIPAGSVTATLGLLTTRGDVYVRGASAVVRLALGATNTIFGSDGTDASYRTLSVILDAVLGNTNGLIATRAGGVWTGATIATLGAVQLAVEDQAITGGGIVTSKDLGTKTAGQTLTMDVGARPLQHVINGGAFTLAPGTNTGNCVLDITNNGSAGAITTSGFTKVVGDAFTTTNTNKFRCFISVGQVGSVLSVVAMQ